MLKLLKRIPQLIGQEDGRADRTGWLFHVLGAVEHGSERIPQTANANKMFFELVKVHVGLLAATGGTPSITPALPRNLQPKTDGSAKGIGGQLGFV
jgi:hypothetical protein